MKIRIIKERKEQLQEVEEEVLEKLQAIVEEWEPETPEGKEYEQNILALLGGYSVAEARGEKTPEEVKHYAEKIKKSKSDVENPYAVAWKTARQPGSMGGTKVVEQNENLDKKGD